MRLPRLLPAASLALVVACDDPSAPGPLPVESPSAAISDGSHGGNPDFFWLPPLASNPSAHVNWDVGGFNSKLLVQIDVCRLDKNPVDFPPGTPTAPNPDAAKCVPGPVVAHFGSNEIAMSLTEEMYSVQWKTDGLDPTAFYRMFAYVGTREPPGITLGFLDLDPVDKGMKNLRTGEVVAFQEGRNLPIKFRVERGALCENRSACVETTVSNDNPAGDHQTVALTTASGTIAGALFPDGWLPATGPQSVVVTIERVNTGINDVVNGTQQFPCHAGLPLQQFDGCFRFTTQPALAVFIDEGIQKQFAREVTVAGCFVLHERAPEDPRERFAQLWASGPDEETRPLPSADAPASVLTNHDCDGALGLVGQQPVRFALVNAALDRLGAGLARVFGVRRAYAVDLGLGGLTWQFSNVGPVVSARIETVGSSELTVPAGGSALPSVRVLGTTTHDGSPLGTGIPGVSVNFTAAPGNGTVQAIEAPPTAPGTQSLTVLTSTSFEDPDSEGEAGFALVRWTVPAAPGTYTLTATAAATGGPVTFTATVPAVTINVVEPPELTNVVDGLVGSPSIVLRDASGAALPGVVVTFATVSGGSVLTDSVVTTNADGYASLGSWRLGPTPTMNIIEARAAGAVPTRISVRGTWLRRLTVGSLTACVIDRASQVQCWGDNQLGQFGAGAGQFSPVPIAAGAPALTRFSTAGGQALCGFGESGSAICWGRSSFGMLTSAGGTGTVSLPVAITGGPYAEVSVARLSACGLTGAGVGYCWGSNQRGEIGSASVPVNLGANPTPMPIDGGLTLSAIVAGWIHACALTETGAAHCWGLRELLGAGGTPADTISRVPLPVSGGHAFTQLAIGPHHTCGLTAEGRVWCWGLNASGQLGDGTQLPRRVPVEVVTPLRFSSIGVSDFIVQGVGSGHTCALTDAGEAYCWGLNDRGQLGDGTTTNRLLPTAVGGGTRFTALELGDYSTCGMRGDSVWCWGGNNLGQVGDGTTVNRSLPVLLGGQID